MERFKRILDRILFPCIPVVVISVPVAAALLAMAVIMLRQSAKQLKKLKKNMEMGESQ